MPNAEPRLPRVVSLYLDCVRFASAAVVFIYHLSYSGFGGRWIPISNAGGDAVMAFFVLSGLIVAYTAEREQELSAFMIARLTRLWSVVVPALLLTFVLDAVGQAIDPAFYTAAAYNGDHPVFRLVANGLFINEIWFRSIVPLSNLPFWSLGFEFWNYVLFAAAFYCRGWKRYAACCAAALFAGPKILLLLPIWLFGVLVLRVGRRWTAPEPVGWLMALGPLLLYASLQAAHMRTFLDRLTQSTIGPELFDLLGNAQSCLWFNLIGALIATHFLGFFAIRHRFEALQRVEGAVRRLAGCTFSCYLFHLPLFMCLAAIFRPGPDSIAPNLVIAACAALVIGVLGPPVEASRFALRSILARREQPLGGVDASHGESTNPTDHSASNSDGARILNISTQTYVGRP